MWSLLYLVVRALVRLLASGGRGRDDERSKDLAREIYAFTGPTSRGWRGAIARLDWWIDDVWNTSATNASAYSWPPLLVRRYLLRATVVGALHGG